MDYVGAGNTLNAVHSADSSSRAKMKKLSHKFFEKYDVVHGRRAIPDRYPDQAGFAWINAIFRRFTEFVATGKLWADDSETSFELTTRCGEDERQ